MRAFAAFFPLALLLATEAGTDHLAASPERQETVRGITVSTHGAGKEWGSAKVMKPTFSAIKALGSNWVAIHPYAAIRADGSVQVWHFDDGDPPAYLAEPIRAAHALGLKILIKPHLAYWGSPFSWRGEITFEDEASWQRFWRDYEAWIVSLARLTHQADGFVIGTELDKTLHHEAAWRRLITKVRAETGAPLTYAANWPDYERVPFWDALDVIGIQAYFPITDDENPNPAALRQGWVKGMAKLRTFADRQERDIIFTELGYNRSFAAPVRPWEYRTDGPEAEPLQQACLRIALEAIEAEPRVVGAFLWKWFPEPRPVGRNFQLATPGIKEVISGVWRR